MRASWSLAFCLIVLSGCSSVGARKQEMATAYASLSPSQREMVQHGRIERGMDTNAVYIAWGKPSAVELGPYQAEGDQTWQYYGSKPVLVPAWTYIPDAYGYWVLQYSPEHYSVRYIKGTVHFHDGRVVDWTQE